MTMTQERSPITTFRLLTKCLKDLVKWLDRIGRFIISVHVRVSLLRVDTL